MLHTKHSKLAEIALRVWIHKLKKDGVHLSAENIKKKVLVGAEKLGVSVQDMADFARFSVDVIADDVGKMLDNLVKPKK